MYTRQIYLVLSALNHLLIPFDDGDKNVSLSRECANKCFALALEENVDESKLQMLWKQFYAIYTDLTFKQSVRRLYKKAK